MSIATFVASAIDNLNSQRPDVGLALVCSAVDATASRKYPEIQTNNGRYKRFLKDNMRVITTYGFPGLVASEIRIKCDSIPDVKKDSAGHADFCDILYHIIRCSLVHQCVIDETIAFVHYSHMGDEGNKFHIPNTLVFGLLMAVVLTDCNANQRLDRDYRLRLNNEVLDLNDLWGTYAEFADKDSHKRKSSAQHAQQPRDIGPQAFGEPRHA